MTDSLIHILTVENKEKFTAEQIEDIVKYGGYLSTVGVGATEIGLTNFSLMFNYDHKPVILKFA